MSGKHSTKLFGDFIDFITYGQVGNRIYSKKGIVRYIQTINITLTGIDYFIKKHLLMRDLTMTQSGVGLSIKTSY